jgi:GNAT superfamily N-acetyltransferase
MHVFVFKDRCGRAIYLEFDEQRTHAVAYHRHQAVGELKLAYDVGPNGKSPALVHLHVEPAYRMSGIAHSLLAHACEVTGEAIIADPEASPCPSIAFATLCRCLLREGLLITA